MLSELSSEAGSEREFRLLKLLTDALRKGKILMDKLEAQMILNRCLAELIDKYEEITAMKPNKRSVIYYGEKNQNKRGRKVEKDEDADDAVMINLDL